MNKQTLTASIPLMEEAIQSKERLEALAFAMQVKLTFVDSTVRNATVRRCKSIFGLGTSKMSRIIKNGLSFGYIERKNGSLIATNLKSSGVIINIPFKQKTAKKVTSNDIKNDVIKCQYNNSTISDIIRKSVLTNHIQKISSCRDTYNQMTNPKTLTEYHKAKDKVTRMSDVNENLFNGLRLRKIMELTKTGKSKSRRLASSLVNSGIVRKTKNYRVVKWGSSDKCESLQWENPDVHQRIYGDKDYLVMRLADIYTYESNILRYIK